jgi:glutathione S-transferase
MPAELTYFPGSPFARMCRVVILEFGLPVEFVEHKFPPAKEMFDVNPLGQVPALILENKTVFPTFLILEEDSAP